MVSVDQRFALTKLKVTCNIIFRLVEYCKPHSNPNSKSELQERGPSTVLPRHTSKSVFYLLHSPPTRSNCCTLSAPRRRECSYMLQAAAVYVSLAFLQPPASRPARPPGQAAVGTSCYVRYIMLRTSYVLPCTLSHKSHKQTQSEHRTRSLRRSLCLPP